MLKKVYLITKMGTEKQSACHDTPRRDLTPARGCSAGIIWWRCRSYAGLNKVGGQNTESKSSSSVAGWHLSRGSKGTGGRRSHGFLSRRRVSGGRSGGATGGRGIILGVSRIGRRESAAEIADVGLAFFLAARALGVGFNASAEELVADEGWHSLVVVLNAGCRVVGCTGAFPGQSALDSQVVRFKKTTE